MATISRGIKAPIIREGDDIVSIVCDCVLSASKEQGFTLRDRDVVAVTEAVVARAAGNYATIDAIAEDVRRKLGGNTVGLVFPILSRNRFAICLRGIARGARKVVVQLGYPSDEVGNHLVDIDALDDSGIDPYKDVLSVAEFREFENYSHDLHFAPVKPPEPVAEKQPEQATDNTQSNAAKQPEVKPFVFERVDRSVLYEQEKRRRKQEQERELLEREQERISAQPPEQIPDTTPKQPVHVMKAEETENLDVTVFDNPFDGAFEEEISKLEKVTADHDFKPLDDIFSFGSFGEPEADTPHTDTSNANSNTYDKPTPDRKSEAAVDTGFAGEFAKADYNIRKTATAKSSYAANMYRHTVETTQSEQSDGITALYPEIRSDGERLTSDDFDILPSTAVPEISEKAEKTDAIKPAKPNGGQHSHTAPVIKLDAPSIDDLTDSEDIPGSDRRRRSDSAVSRSTAKRLLDGIIKPTKIRNPFIDENDDE